MTTRVAVAYHVDETDGVEWRDVETGEVVAYASNAVIAWAPQGTFHAVIYYVGEKLERETDGGEPLA